MTCKVVVPTPVKQIRRVFDDNFEIILLFLQKHICCGYSLELPRRGNSNEYPHHMFLWRTIENYPLIIIKYPPYLFQGYMFCSLENLKHMPFTIYFS